MSTEMLLKNFKEILSYEQRAKSFYDHYINQIEDEEIKNMFISIRDEEIAHIKIAEELIKSVS